MVNTNYGKMYNNSPQFLHLPIVLPVDVIVDGVIHPKGAYLSTENEQALLQCGYKRVIDTPPTESDAHMQWVETDTEIIKAWETQAEHDNRIGNELKAQGVYEITVPPSQILNAITEKCMAKNPCTLCVTDINGTIAWGGSKEADGDFAAAGVTVYNLGYNGGYIITGANDLSYVIVTPDIGVNDDYYLRRIKSILDQYCEGVTIDHNDILIGGKKVIGAASYKVNGMNAFMFGASFTDYTDLIYQLCPPQTGKAPGYITGCTAEQLRAEIMEWF